MAAAVTIDADALSAAVAALVPAADPAPLVAAVRAATGLDFALAAEDGGWFRLGGVMDAQGRRLTDDIEAWAEAEAGSDLAALRDKFGDAGLRFTRHAGRRFYLTAALGPNPLDFIQVEVDQVQEMLCRPLFDGDTIPDTLAELEELPPAPDAKPLDAARYVHRRVTNFADLPDLVCEHKGDTRLGRFARDWAESSAGADSHFCRRWALQLVPYTNADGEHVMGGRPIGNFTFSVPDLQDARAHAADYHPAREARAIDAQAGFPMAWYFLQIVRHYTHHLVIKDIAADCAGALPAHDAAVVERWVDNPYNFH